MNRSYYGLFDVDIENIVRSQDLVYEDAGTMWQDGHILGNGDIGAICYAPYWLEWTVNKIDVFDSRIPTVKKLTYKEVMSEVKKRKANNLLFLNELEKPNKDYNGPKEPLLKSCGQVKIRTRGNEYSWGAKSPYKIKQVLSLWEAKDYMEMSLYPFNLMYGDLPFSHPKVCSFVSSNSNLLVISMEKATGPMWCKHVELCRPYDGDYKPAVFGSDKDKNLIWFTQEIPDGSSYTMVIGIKTTGGRLKDEYAKVENIEQKGDRIWFTVNGDIDIFVSVATSREAKDYFSLAKEIVLEGMKKGYKKLEIEHKKWWNDFWKKSFIQIDDPMHEQLWYFGLYQAGSSLRKAPIPGLMGLWYGYHDLPVQGFFWAVYTMDQNIQITSMPVFAVNHPELSLPFMDTFLNALPKTIEDTKQRFELPGACYPLEMSFLGGEPYFSPAYRFSFCGGPYCGIIFTWAYKYTQDKELLKTKIYPYLKEVVRFFIAFMEKGNDGRYHLPYTVPAEIFTLSRDAIETISLLKPCLSLAIYASKLFDVDKEEREKWEDVLNNYPEYPEKKGIIVHGSDIELDHPSCHYGYRFYPLILGHDDSEKVRKLVKNTVEHVTPDHYSKEKKRWNCCGWPWLFFTLAKLMLGDKKDIKPLLDTEISKQLKPNGLFPHVPISRGPMSNPRSAELIVSTPENNTAVMMVITEMLMQSYNNLIRLFPGIHGKANVRFGNLRAEGAFLVSSEMVKGKVTFVSITSEKGGISKLENPWKLETINLIRKNGKREKIKGKIISIELKRGETGTLVPENTRLKLKKIISNRKPCPKIKKFSDGTIVTLGKPNKEMIII